MSGSRSQQIVTSTGRVAGCIMVARASGSGSWLRGSASGSGSGSGSGSRS